MDIMGLVDLRVLGSYTTKAFLLIASPRWYPEIEQLDNLLCCLSGIVREALQQKVHIVDTDGLFPVHSS